MEEQSAKKDRNNDKNEAKKIKSDNLQEATEKRGMKKEKRKKWKFDSKIIFSDFGAPLIFPQSVHYYNVILIRA